MGRRSVKTLLRLYGNFRLRNLGVCSKSKHREAHRKKQGAGVVTYVKPLLRSNEAGRRFLGKRISY